jgi:TolB-like protein/class 3 adenylate cyclase
MAEERLQRRLAAILSADVVGYSRLMGLDEAGTLSRLNALRRELIDPSIAAHSGRIVKLMGDGALVEFASAVDAVTCAIEIQRQLRERDAAGSETSPIKFRIGINVGDIIIEDDDILGDGVNIAARIEGVAEPGGIALSEDAWRQVQGKVTANFVDSGEHTLKNIARPVRVYRIELGGEDTIHPSATAPSVPDKPSIAVLPFQNMSGDPEQDYFADGMVEDIVTGLSRIKWLFVIARNSSFVYRGKAVDVRQVGRELGVRYVLEGSVRKTGNRVRITVQLIEAKTGAHLWADRFDGLLEDVFNLQDQITDSVVGIVEPSLRHSEIERSRRKRPGSLDAYDLYLRAFPHVSQMTPAEARIGTVFLEEALKLDPNYGAAHALMALRHDICFIHEPGYVESERVAGLSHARAVIDSGSDDTTALALAALALAHLGRDYDAALTAIARALSLNPSCAVAHYFGAHINGFGGRDVAVTTAHASRALRLSPFDPLAFEAHLALALAAIKEERDDDAVSHFANAVQAKSTFAWLHFAQASATALAGRIADAKLLVERGLELEPTFRAGVVYAAGMAPLVADRLVEGARLLGLPE